MSQENSTLKDGIAYSQSQHLNIPWGYNDSNILSKLYTTVPLLYYEYSEGVCLKLSNDYMNHIVKYDGSSLSNSDLYSGAGELENSFFVRASDKDITYSSSITIAEDETTVTLTPGTTFYAYSNGQQYIYTDTEVKEPTNLNLVRILFFSDLYSTSSAAVISYFVDGTSRPSNYLTRCIARIENISVSIENLNEVVSTAEGYWGYLITDLFDNEDTKKYYQIMLDTGILPSPYTTSNYLDIIQNTALEDLDGRRNTEEILFNTMENHYINPSLDNVEGNYPAATLCSKYNTEGSVPGVWYLPAVGELIYLGDKYKEINLSLNTIRELDKTTAISLGTGSYDSNMYGGLLWSSTEASQDYSWFFSCDSYDCGLNWTNKDGYDDYGRVRAFSLVRNGNYYTPYYISPMEELDSDSTSG